MKIVIKYQIKVVLKVKSLARVCKGTMFNKNTTRSVPEKLLSTKSNQIVCNKDGKIETFNYGKLYQSLFCKVE